MDEKTNIEKSAELLDYSNKVIQEIIRYTTLLEAKLETSNNKLEEKKQLIDALTKKNNEMTASIEKLSEKINDLSTTIKNLDTSFKKQITEKDNQIRLLEDEKKSIAKIKEKADEFDKLKEILMKKKKAKKAYKDLVKEYRTQEGGK